MKYKTCGTQCFLSLWIPESRKSFWVLKFWPKSFGNSGLFFKFHRISTKLRKTSQNYKNYAENVLPLKCNFEHAEDLHKCCKYTSRLFINASIVFAPCFIAVALFWLTPNALLFIFENAKQKVHLFSVQLYSHSVFLHCVNRELLNGCWVGGRVWWEYLIAILFQLFWMKILAGNPFCIISNPKCNYIYLFYFHFISAKSSAENPFKIHYSFMHKKTKTIFKI